MENRSSYLFAFAKQIRILPKENGVNDICKPGVISVTKSSFNACALSSVEKERRSFTQLGAAIFSNIKELGNLLNID